MSTAITREGYLHYFMSVDMVCEKCEYWNMDFQAYIPTSMGRERACLCMASHDDPSLPSDPLLAEGTSSTVAAFTVHNFTCANWTPCEATLEDAEAELHAHEREVARMRSNEEYTTILGGHSY